MNENAIELGRYFISISEIKFRGIRSSGPGGQHVNKVSSTVQLKFDILKSTLPDEIKVKLLQSRDARISKKGIFTIKSSTSRSQSKNKKTAIVRLQEFVNEEIKERKKRIPTITPKAAKLKRKKNKQHKSDKKSSRKKPRL